MKGESEHKYIRKFVAVLQSRYPSLSKEEAQKLVDRLFATMFDIFKSGHDLSALKTKEDGQVELTVYSFQVGDSGSREKPPDISNVSVEDYKEPMVFLCHSSSDKPQIRNLYQELRQQGLKPWLDEEDIIPGKQWEDEIRRAIRESDFFLACLSQNAVDKRGYVQKEIKMALDVLDEIPDGKIYLIPVRLEDCIVPDRLRGYQWVDLYEPNGFPKLLKTLRYD